MADKAGKRGTESALGYEEMEGVLKLLDLEKATNDPPLILQDLIWSLDPVESGSISLLAIEIAFDEWASSVRPFYPNKGSIPSGAETLLRSSPFVDLDVYYREPVALRGKRTVFPNLANCCRCATATSKCEKNSPIMLCGTLNDPTLSSKRHQRCFLLHSLRGTKSTWGK